MPNPTSPLTDPTIGKGPHSQINFNGANNVITMNDYVDPNSGLPVGYYVDGGAGDDIITGSSNDDTLVGGNGSDIVSGGNGADTIYGAKESGDEGKGRADTVNSLYGELASLTASGDVSASNDTIFGGDGATNNIYGDYGDLDLSGGFAFTGGNDVIHGGSLAHRVGAVNNIHGDAEFVTMGTGSVFVGGDDMITGGADSDNSMYGDAFDVTFTGAATFTGGNDTIRGGDGAGSTNDLYGDAQRVHFGSNAVTYTNGNDTLISGAGANDFMSGDTLQYFNDGSAVMIGGADTFVFATGNGRDIIMDFHNGEDTVLLQGIAGFTSYEDVMNAFTTWVGSGSTIVLDLDGTVDGIGDLVIFSGHTDASDFSAADFMFA